MLEEIEEFLRRAAEKRGEVLRPPGQQQRPVQIEYVDPDVVDVEVVEPEIVGEQRHSGSSAYHLPESQIGQADERLESRLHDTFDHRLGSLDPDGAKMASDKAEYEAPVTPNEIAKMLGSPSNLRNAIVLSEILQPPEHRW